MTLLKKIYLNYLLFIISCCTAFLIGEWVLRIAIPTDKYMVHQPHIHLELEPIADLFPGLSEKVILSTNHLGYRATTNFTKHRLGIMAIGGSTTECSLLNQEETWCTLLEDQLNNAVSKPMASIGNFGKSGLNTAHHVLELKYLPSQFENVRIVLLLVGVNDFLRALDMGTQYFPAKEDKNLQNKTFAQIPRNKKVYFFQRTAWWAALKALKWKFNTNYSKLDSEEISEKFNTLRAKHQFAPKIDTLPDLTIPLMNYEKNLEEIIMLTKAANLKLVLLTQPTLWKENMDSLENKIGVHWLSQEDSNFYTWKALQQGMEQYNERLHNVAKNAKIPMIDLASILPKDTTVFYDYCHFNRGGAVQVAKAIKPVLLEMLEE